MPTLRQAFGLDKSGVVSIVGAGGKTSLMYKLAHELVDSGDSVLTTTTTKIFRPDQEQCSNVILADSVATVLKQSGSLLKHHRHITAAFGQASKPNKLIGFAPDDIDQLWQSGLFRWVIVEADGAARLPLKAPAAHEPVFPESTKWTLGVVGLSALGKPLNDKTVFRPEIFAQLTGLLPGTKINEAAVAEALIHPKGIFKDSPPLALRSVFLNQADIPGGISIGRRIAAALQERQDSGLSRIIIGQAAMVPPVLECIDLKAKGVKADII